jgi:hypothetical protein
MKLGNWRVWGGHIHTTGCGSPASPCTMVCVTGIWNLSEVGRAGKSCPSGWPDACSKLFCTQQGTTSLFSPNARGPALLWSMVHAYVISPEGGRAMSRMEVASRAPVMERWVKFLELAAIV